MVVYWLGVFDGVKWRVEYQLRRAFEQQGLELRCVNYRSGDFHPAEHWGEYGRGVDVVFLQNGKGFRGEWLHLYESRPVVYWATEASWNNARHVLAGERKPDVVVANSIQTFRECRKRGFKVIRMHNGFDPALYKRTNIHEQFDVCLLGVMTRRRKSYLRYLQHAFGPTLRIRTAKRYTAEQANNIYNASKVILHVHAIHQNYIPSRLFEGMPTRGCMLVEAMGQNYDPKLGRGYFMEFSGMSDMCAKVKELVRNTKARERIVRVANKLAPQNTWAARARTLTTILREARQCT